MNPTDTIPTSADYGSPVWPPFEAVEALLRRWAREHPDRMRLDALTRSAEGRAVHAVRLTDPSVDDCDKEHALLTCLHSGVERSGTTALLCILEWLLSDDALARETLRRQVVVGVPVAHPDGYVHGYHGNVYGPWAFTGPQDPRHMPEAMAIKGLMDLYQPELHADLHGMSLDFAKYAMLENSGNPYSNLGLRCHNREIVRLMDEAALAEGYPSDWQESDSEQVFWGPELESMGLKLWEGRPRVYAAVYCHNLYHTLLSASEVNWERSGLLRHRRLLRVGNETWPGEYYAGYPTRVMLSNQHQMITAYGSTAAARRRSRVEIWNSLPRLVLGMADPMVEGKHFCVCSTLPAAAATCLESQQTLAQFVAGLRTNAAVDAGAIERFVKGWPAGQNGPEPYLLCRGGDGKPEGEATPLQHGLALRLRIPDDQAQVTDLRVNGHPVCASETDGFISWTGRGMTFLQVNIPPSRLACEGLFVVTCAYTPGAVRTRWRAS
jgi:hypothetical protein